MESTELESGSGNAAWFVQRGDQQFEAADLPTMLTWCRDRRVFRTDLVHNVSFGLEWRKAGEVAELRNAFPVATIGTRHRLAFGLVGCFGFLLVAVVIGAFSRGGHQGTTPQSVGVTGVSAEREDMERMFADRFGMEIQVATSEMGQRLLVAGDTAGAQNLFRLANHNYQRVGLDMARGLSDRNLEKALQDQSIIRGLARATIKEAAK